MLKPLSKLVLDVGNTRTKVGLFQGSRHMRWGTVANGDVETVAAFARGFHVAHVVLGSTATPDPVLEVGLAQVAPVHVITGSSPTPLHSAYATPQSLGADRSANAVAAVRRFPGRAVLVLDLGTCITYDLCLADGTYAGGGISPGVRMRAQAMHAYSARLPLVEFVEEPPLVGTTTVGSLAAGIHHGVLGELVWYLRQFRGQHPHLAVVLTGGDAPRFVRGLESGIFALPLLTLEGSHALLVHHRSQRTGYLAPAAPAGDGPGPTG